MSMHNAVTIELITSSKGQKKDLIILSSPHVYKTRKQKITVTSNPVMTIYGSGACPTMKKIIDVTVTTNRRNFTKHFRVQQKGRRLTTGRGVSILPTDPTVTPLFQAFSINGSRGRPVWAGTPWLGWTGLSSWCSRSAGETRSTACLFSLYPEGLAQVLATWGQGRKQPFLFC